MGKVSFSFGSDSLFLLEEILGTREVIVNSAVPGSSSVLSFCVGPEFEL